MIDRLHRIARLIRIGAPAWLLAREVRLAGRRAILWLTGGVSC